VKYKPLSEQDKKLLILASERVSEAIEKQQDSDPNQVIAKVAADLGIKPGHIKVLVHGYNAGRTEFQRKSSEDLSEKLAAFHLADTDKVLGHLYSPGKPPSDLEKKSSLNSTDYVYTPRELLQRAKQGLFQEYCSPIGNNHEALEKSASVCARSPQSQRSFPSSTPERGAPSSLAELSEPELRREEIRLRLEVCRLEKSALEDLNNLKSYFSKSAALHPGDQQGALPYPLVLENCRAVYGDKAVKILTAAVAGIPTQYLEKQAQAAHFHFRSSGLPPVQWHLPPYSYVDRLLKSAQEYTRSLHRWQQVTARLAKLSREKRSSIIHRHSSSSSSSDASSDTVSALFRPPPRTPGSLKQAGTFSTTLAGTFGGALGVSTGRGLAKMVGGPLVESKDDLVADLHRDMVTPDHEEKLRSISVKSMLTDLMANDEVISNYSPKEVVQAYNEIYDLAPNVATKQMIVRAYLRKRLQQGSFDQFDVDSLLNADRRLKGPASKGSLREGEDLEDTVA
jgi:hypothetical protein